ncbi:MAG: hypothetical protein Q9195_005212 [Heterodermia aff. obscurata]
MILFPLGVAILHYLGPKYDPREPPVIRQKVPYFGHLIGLISYGVDYFEHVSKKHNLPIYTLQTLTKRIYVICSLDLVLAAQKDTKRLSLNPFIATFIPRMFHLGKRDMEIIALNHDGEKGDWGFLPETHNKSFSTLAPGSDMDWMIRTALSSATIFLNNLDKEARRNGKTIDLYGWTRKILSLVSTQAVFTAPKAHSARLKIQAAMYSYYSRNGQDQASTFLRARHEVGKRTGMSLDGISSLELGDCLAVLANATPAVFWMIWHIYSDPTLLQNLRDELNSIISETTEQDGKHLRLNVGQLKSHCPYFHSTYQEVLRVRTHSASHRWVMEDTLLSDRFLMKKGNAIEMPGHVIHANASLWGNDANDFNPRRFMKSEGYSIKAGSLRAFGGGKALCPGRHFAAMEIMSVVAMMVVRFDITPWGAEGWVDPQCALGKVISVIPPPAADIKTVVSVREGYRNVKWEFGSVGEERADTGPFDVT